MQQLVRRLWLQNGHYMCNAAWQRRPNSIAERQLCQCSLELVKPKHRLQRLFHSLQPGGASIVNGKSDLQISSPPSEKELNELRLLVNLLPQRLQPALLDRSDLSALVEVILDLGRPPVARFSGEDVRLSEDLVTRLDLQAAVEQVGSFGDDNRAGIDRTLHRVSCIRNRDGDIVGLTCRAGRAVYGCACLAADFAKEGKSILVLGKPGVGKTTAIRELGRYLAEDVQKRVIIVDTSNEIGGDGDVPHEGIGGCRRLQVKHVHQQHNVMIEAVENHMPEVVVIDEIGNQDESMAARTISQRGVQMVATAHGHKLENLLKNPALVELLGGIEIVTIGDESAKKRGLPRKSVRERAGPPSFDIAIELLERQEWLIYPNVAQAVDDLLKNKEPRAITRKMASKKMNPNVVSTVTSSKASVNKQTSDIDDRRPQMPGGEDIISVFPVGLDHDKILHARTLIGDEAQRMRLVFNLEFADVVLALRSQMKPKSLARDAARAANVPVYAVKSGTSRSMLKAIQTLLGVKSDNLEDSDDEEEDEEPKNHVVSMTAARNEAGALDEAREAVEQIVKETGNPVELLPRAPKVLEAQKAMLQTEFKDHPLEVLGTGLQSRLRIHPPADWQEKDGIQNMGFLSNAL